ncbi:glycerol-3-phosphate dehydrogenase/oxidase [Opitutaceae bacterium EW11]|nr:glycerol-3-phosphate dehydrogenase/oxidase [Opitutaceae bacterium EW11]
MNDSLPEKRDEARRALTETTLDVLVIGGGITGSGIARDAATRGLHTGLVDRYDFAFGTSSRSSRLLHGGLRYLEQGRLGLVREASVEKKTIRAIAPHLAEPMGFVFPAYKQGGRPLWQLRIGVKLYDLLCSGRNFNPSRGFAREETLRALPSLESEGLLGSVRYFDALTNDARLVLDTLRSAVRHGARISNYVRFHDARRTGDLWTCDLEDTLAGHHFTVLARTLVNATGPWAEKLPHSAVKLRLSKGIHLVVDRRRLPVNEAVVITEGKRILFLIPWGGRVIVGTTDTDFAAAPEKVRVEAKDVAYVLRTVNESFPALRLNQDDVISAWAGLRPLIANPDGSPSDISRAHQIVSPEPGWWDVSGGKLTTYRLMAEQTVDRILTFIGRKPVPCRTAAEPLLPPDATRFSSTVPPACTREAVEHFVRDEWAVHLDDVMLRRSSWHYYCAESAAVASEVASWMEEICHWPAARRAKEMAAYLEAADWRHASPEDCELAVPGPEAAR